MHHGLVQGIALPFYQAFLRDGVVASWVEWLTRRDGNQVTECGLDLISDFREALSISPSQRDAYDVDVVWVCVGVEVKQKVGLQQLAPKNQS